MSNSVLNLFALRCKTTASKLRFLRFASIGILSLILVQSVATQWSSGDSLNRMSRNNAATQSDEQIDHSSTDSSRSFAWFVQFQESDVPPAANGPVVISEQATVSPQQNGEPTARLAQSQRPSPRASDSKKSNAQKPKKLRDLTVADIIERIRTANEETSSPWDTQLATAIKNLSERQLPDPESAKLNAQKMAYQLERLLSPEYNDNGAAWLDFLHWEELNEQLQSDKPSRSILRQLALNMRQNYPGLEIAQFVQLRDSIERYIEALQYGRNADASLGIFEDRIVKLAQVLSDSPQGSDLDQSRAISLLVKYLRQSNQAPSLLNALRNKFSHANVRVLVSSEFAQRELLRPVMENQPVNESILGTAIRGTSTVSGNVLPRFVTNNHAATVQLHLDASFSSNNVGTNRGVKIYSVGSSPISANETIQLTDSGLISLNDTTVGSHLNTNVTGIEHKCRIVRRIAKKKISQQKSQADSIAEGRLQNRLKQQFHEQIGEQLAEANVNLTPPDLPVLDRLGLPRPARRTWTSGNYLALLWKEATDEQLMAPASCPLPVEPTGVSIQLHHSLISNLIDPILAGRNIKNTDLDNFAQQFGGDIPVGVQAESEEKPWAITLAAHHPVEVDFEDNRVVFILKTTRLERAGQALPVNAIITVKYRVDLYNGTIQLVRDGTVDIEFSGRSGRIGGIRGTTYRSFLQGKFDQLFQEELLPEPISIAGALPAEVPQVQLLSITADQGWLQIHVK